MLYQKDALTVAQQVDQLQFRGLLVADVALARHYLTNISYYRLAGYWWAMQADKTTHQFNPNSTFEHVIALYDFDRELRLMLFDEIERIEISLRTRLIYHLLHEKNPWWLEEFSLFDNSRELVKTLASINAEPDRSKYSSPTT